MARVEVRFDGVSRGAVSAARSTRLELAGVGKQARLTEGELGRLTRGVAAGSGLFRGLGRSVAFASAGFLGGYGLTAAIGGAVKELTNSIRVTAQTNQALRTTGSVAGITAKGIDALAKSIMHKAGVDDEAVKSAENLLLTFTRVRNEAGKGNDVFNQATKTVVDLSAVLGQDLQQSAIQVGKALNDPITGMTALRRVGVSFTAQQREQIKTLVEHGHLLQAQRIILRELQTEFGGQAAAQNRATGGYRSMREEVKNLSGDLLRDLMPQFRQLVSWLRQQVEWLTHTREGQARLRKVTHELKDAVKGTVTVIKTMFDGLRLVNRVTGGWYGTLKLLVALKLATILTGWTGALQKLIGTEAVAGAAGATGMAGAAAKSSLLLASLRSLAKIGLITIAVELLFNYKSIGRQVGDAVDKAIGAIYGYGPSDEGYTNRPSGRLSGVIQQGIRSMARRGLNARQIQQELKAQYGITATLPEIRSAMRGDRTGSQAAGRAEAGNVSAIQSSIVQTAKTQLGVPYKWGGTTWNVGMDCSGFVQQVMARNGIRVPRTSQQQAAGGVAVPLGELMPGDLVFTEGWPHPGHVAIYIGGGQIIEEPHTGAATRIRSLRSFGPVGVGKRYWAGGFKAPSGTAGGYTPQAAFVSTTPTGAGAAAGAGKKAAAPTGATAAMLIPIRASITNALASLRGLSPEIRKYLAPITDTAKKHLEELKAHLKLHMTPADLAQTRSSISRWEKVLKDSISKATKAARDAAAEQQRLLQRVVDQAIQDRFQAFDRETADHNRVFERETSDHIAAMRKAFDQQMREFDRETEAGLLARQAPGETAEEQTLRQFREARQAEQDAAAMAQALASGDPEQVRQLQLDLQERYLQDQADQSRKAADKQAEDSQRAYREQRDDQRQALDQQENDREQAYQDERDAEARAYSDMRDQQLQHMKDDLDDWQAWLDAKKKTWQQFLEWLRAHGFAVPDSWLTDNAGNDLTAAFRARAAALQITLRSSATPMQHGGTIRAPKFVGRGDVLPAMLSHGETVIDHHLTEKLDRLTDAGGGGHTFIFHNPQFHGTTPREVRRELARLVGPALNHRVGFTNPRL